MFAVTSTAFRNRDEIPKKYSGEGENISPPLAWSELPIGTVELALVCEDPDAPTEEPFVHWVLYGLSRDVYELPEGLPAQEVLRSPVAAFQGVNSFSQLGYGGPLPPVGDGPHRYHFRLYALNKMLKLKPGLDEKHVMKAIKNHVIQAAELVGLYQRGAARPQRAI